MSVFQKILTLIVAASVISLAVAFVGHFCWVHSMESVSPGDDGQSSAVSAEALTAEEDLAEPQLESLDLPRANGLPPGPGNHFGDRPPPPNHGQQQGLQNGMRPPMGGGMAGRPGMGGHRPPPGGGQVMGNGQGRRRGPGGGPPSGMTPPMMRGR